MNPAENQQARLTASHEYGNGQDAELRLDAHLLALICGGDQQALAALYRRRGNVIYSLLVRILNDEMEAQEVMQDTFVQIWRRAAGWDVERSSPMAWMIMIARGRAIDRLRARSRRMASHLAYEQELVSLELEVNAVREKELDQLAGACASALNQLPEEQGRALQLAFFRGWTHQEIASAAGEPLGTVKARIRRGLLALRKIMKDYYA